MSAPPDVSVVLLTRGDRPAALGAAIASVRAQTGVTTEVVVVWNGVEPDGSGSADTDIVLPENVGIPEGRNRGAEVAIGPLVFFLDDDAVLLSTTLLSDAVATFDADHRLGVVSCRIVDEHGETSQRHVPRLGGGSALRSGPVTSFLGGVCIARASAMSEVGGLPGPFFYALEETDLAWRLIDAGWTIRYDADLVVQHPRTDPGRHPAAVRRTARNRVWLAHRLLPLPLAVLYVADWAAATTARTLLGAVRRRDLSVTADLRALAGGTRDGWSQRIGPRRPIRWRTVWRLGRLGRPPVI